MSNDASSLEMKRKKQTPKAREDSENFSSTQNDADRILILSRWLTCIHLVYMWLCGSSGGRSGHARCDWLSHALYGNDNSSPRPTHLRPPLFPFPLPRRPQETRRRTKFVGRFPITSTASWDDDDDDVRRTVNCTSSVG